MSTRSISGASKIVLKGKYTEGGVEHEEGRLAVAGYPGMNVVMRNDHEEQGRQVWQPGSSEYAGTGTNVTTVKAPLRILVEDAYQSHTVADAWEADDACRFHICSPGEIIQVLVASGETVLRGSGLTANSAGKFVVDATNAAVEALEPTGGALASDKLVRVRVL